MLSSSPAPKPGLGGAGPGAKGDSPSFVVARPVSSGFYNARNVNPVHVGFSSVFMLSCLLTFLFIADIGQQRGLMSSRFPDNVGWAKEVELCNSRNGTNGTQVTCASKATSRPDKESVVSSQEDELDFQVALTVLEDGETAGVCLDGSPPAYHFSPGFGSGSSKWVVYLEGGGWCTSAKDCRTRARTRLGSSRKMTKTVLFGGVLSNNSNHNPWFFNWNRVFVRYCDGCSFAGQPQEGSKKFGVATDGQQVFERVMKHLLKVEGMEHATHVLLAGSSAGGLAALLHCDQFADIFRTQSVRPRTSPWDSELPRGSGQSEAQKGQGERAGRPRGPRRQVLSATSEFGDEKSETGDEKSGTGDEKSEFEIGKLEAVPAGEIQTRALLEHRPIVKCLSDAGFFPDVNDVTGRRTLRNTFSSVVDFHHPVLSPDCAQAQGAVGGHQCFFAEHFLRHVHTPFFLLSPLYDLWLIRHAFAPEESGDVPLEWSPCRKYLEKCSARQLQSFHDYREEMIEKVKSVLGEISGDAVLGGKGKLGAFLDSCRTHGQAIKSQRWHGPGAPRVNNRTVGEVVASWFWEEGEAFEVDCEWPCNPTCYPHAIAY